MMEKLSEPKRPAGLTRMVFRLPLALYRSGLGALLGERFLHLIHTGRSSGLRREAVIEVVEFNAAEDVYYLASGWGERSDWYRNLLANQRVEAQVGRRRFNGRAEKVGVEAAAELFSRYGARHPGALQLLARIMGYRIAANDADYRALGRVIPVIAVHVEQLHG